MYIFICIRMCIFINIYKVEEKIFILKHGYILQIRTRFGVLAKIEI